MKNRIMAILVIILMCFSMITPVFAATTTTYKGTELMWESTVYNGDVYQIKYFHPQGYDKVYIMNHSGSGNVRDWNFIYYNDSTKFGTSKYQITGGSIIQATFNGLSYMSPTFAQLEANTKSLLFNENDTNYRTKNFTLKTANDGETLNLIGGVPNPTGPMVLEVGTQEFENWYVSWYYESFGNYPPLATDDNVTEEIEYMDGNYYLVLQQPIVKTHAGGGITRPEEGEEPEYKYSVRGYVETMEDVTLTSKDGTYVYVVISSHKPNGNIYGVRGFENLAIHLQLLLTEKGNRNNYYWEDQGGYILNNADGEEFTRYYFSSAQEAAKFVLYGTAGAEYQYKDKTNYGYGYSDCMYNNYEINYYGVKTVPPDEYPLNRVRIILRWHDEDVYDREYLMIDYDYFPYATLVSSEKKLLISQKLNPTYKRAWKIDEVNSDTFDPFNVEEYEETDIYDGVAMQRFQLYHEDLEEMYVSNSWDIIYQTYTIFPIIQNGDDFTAGDITTADPVSEMFEDKDGNKYFINHLTNELFKEGSENAYTDPDGDGIYTDKDGNTIDINDLTSNIKSWQESIIHYSTNLAKISNVIDEFTNILDYASNEIKPLTSLFNAFFSSLPSIFKTIVTFMLIAVILSRIIKRR